jgi:hypothetical protein
MRSFRRLAHAAHHKLARPLALCLTAGALSACADTGVTSPDLAPRAIVVAPGPTCSTIDFTTFSHGGAVTSVTAAGATWTVTSNPYVNPDGLANPNTLARAFDTDAITPLEDRDLMWNAGVGGLCPSCNGLGRILIIEDPDGFASSGDSRWGGVLGFTTATPGTYYITSFTAIDDDGGEPAISLHLDGAAGAVASSTSLGNGSVEVVSVPATTFSSAFDFRLGTVATDAVTGSGGVDNITVCRAPSGVGTRTQGYWKNHPNAWPAPYASSIPIGGVTYSKSAAISLMQAATKGDKTYTMFQQLVAAKLNVAKGAESSCIASTIAAADAWMASHPVGSGVSASSSAWSVGGPLHDRLDDYNNGLLCAPHED